MHEKSKEESDAKNQSNNIQNTETNQTQDALLLNTVPNNSDVGKLEDINDEGSDIDNEL